MIQFQVYLKASPGLEPAAVFAQGEGDGDALLAFDSDAEHGRESKGDGLDGRGMNMLNLFLPSPFASFSAVRGQLKAADLIQMQSNDLHFDENTTE